MLSGVLMKTIDIFADQFIGIEIRQLYTNIAFRLLEHVQNTVVHINNVKIIISQHDSGMNTIQRLVNPCRFYGFLPGLRQIQIQFHFH